MHLDLPDNANFAVAARWSTWESETGQLFESGLIFVNQGCVAPRTHCTLPVTRVLVLLPTAGPRASVPFEAILSGAALSADKVQIVASSTYSCLVTMVMMA